MKNTSEQIARAPGIRDAPGHPATRIMIRAAIKELWLPVGANENGYYWLTTEAELERYLRNLRRRIAGIAARIAAVEANYYGQAKRSGQVYNEAAKEVGDTTQERQGT